MTEAVMEADLLDSLTPEQAGELYRQVLAARARQDDVGAVAAFGELVFGVQPAVHHRAWIGYVLENLRTGIVAPPESAKTTWITKILVAWWIGKHPLSTNGICSASDETSQKMAAAIADTIENNPRWALVFPNIVPDKGRGWSSTGYHVKDSSLEAGEWARLRYGTLDASLMAAGVGSSSWNGVRITGFFDFDDMHDRRSKTQQKTNDDTVEFFNDTALPRATAEAHVVVVQTRWNPKDVIARLKALANFRVFEHAALIRVEGEPERSYWPEQWPLERLYERQAEITPVVFELVYQGNDRAAEGHILKAAWLHDFPFLQIKREWNRYFGIDPAIRLREIERQDDDPDRFSLNVFADTGTRLVMEDVFAEELYGPDAEELFFAKAAIYQPRNTGLEVNGAAARKYYQALLAQMRLRGLNYVITPVTRTKAKGEYLAIMAPYYASAQVMVSDEPTPGLARFRAEWLAFPGPHDDTLDGAYNGWSIASFTLPRESVPVAQARENAARNYVTPAQAIERAYR